MSDFEQDIIRRVRIETQVDTDTIKKSSATLDNFYKKYQSKNMKVDTSDFFQAVDAVRSLRKELETTKKNAPNMEGIIGQMSTELDKVEQQFERTIVHFTNGDIANGLNEAVDKIASGLSIQSVDLGDYLTSVEQRARYAVDSLKEIGALSSHNNHKYIEFDNLDISQMNQAISLIQELFDAQKELDEFNGKPLKSENFYSDYQTQALLRIKNCPYKIAMTGTPIMNKNIDLYPIMNWLGYENKNYWEFRDKYCKMGGFKGKQIVGDKNSPELHARLSQFMIRRKKDDVLDLPPKIFINEVLEMDGKQWALYQKMQSLVKSQLAQMKGNKNALLGAMLNLRKITCHPGWVDEDYKDSVKYERARQIIYEASENNQKTIIFSCFTTPFESDLECVNLKKDLEVYNPAMIIGDTKDRMEQVEKFQNDPTCKVIIGSIGAMGVGLTLNAAANVIFLDEPWNKALKDQAVDRSHRPGTKHTVNVYTLMCKDTVDEGVHKIVTKKGRLADEIVDGVSVEELEQLLEGTI
jgi:hypothetical protein